jgi:hypothetical protein
MKGLCLQRQPASVKLRKRAPSAQEHRRYGLALDQMKSKVRAHSGTAISPLILTVLLSELWQ